MDEQECNWQTGISKILIVATRMLEVGVDWIRHSKDKVIVVKLTMS